ncbi:MAG: hypothetical protein FH762_05150 [Firmicutes bacterium]|nr:hypothetical protein [Bacillota bacterium]
MIESDTGYRIYAIGSWFFDENDYDWACNEDYIPKNKYLTIKEGEVNSMHWSDFNQLCIESLVNILGDLSNSIPVNLQYITTGFDDGDLDIVWSVKDERY